MKIIWYGHSCFEITGNDGTVIFDPYQEGSVPGLNKLHLKGNLVLCSHDHDDHHLGSHRGKNTIHILTYENMKVVHMGDIGCMIDDLSKIKNCDVLMIPIGGYYTIDTKEALEYNNQIQPRIVIPMHYRSGDMGYDVLSTNEEFIKNRKDICYVKDVIEVDQETRKQTVIFEKPRN